MSVPRWNPSRAISKRETYLLKRLERTKKLFAFLRLHRLALFDEGFQDELAAMYQDSDEGKTPVAPALLSMAILLQAYSQTSDAEAVELTVVDARWQLVLGVLGSDRPAFSQGTLQRFRERLIAHDLDRRLLERTVELAKQTRGFDFKKLPKTVRLAVDSRPLTGAARVEDTFNLLGHAARKLLACAAALAEREPQALAVSIGAPALAASSVKRGLDIDWNDRTQKNDAIKKLVEQIDRLESWVRTELAGDVDRPPLSEQLLTLAQLRGQDLEPDPDGGGALRIRRGVAEDRRISIEDPDMRHGRKSKSQTIKGYKSHLATDVDTTLIMAVGVTPANRHEAEALPGIVDDLSQYTERNQIGELQIDRGYLASAIVQELAAKQIPIISKPWGTPGSDLFEKRDFHLDLARWTITCPANQTLSIQPGSVAQFPGEICGACPLRARCTNAAPGRGRSVAIGHDERLQKKLRTAIRTPRGRAHARQRVVIEHTLAHHAQKQGSRARYRGVRKNIFDARRHATIVNLETIHFAAAA